jgi:hypothetical protein
MRRHHVIGPLLAVLVGCSGETPAGPSPGAPPPSAQPRTYAMGWGLQPPKPTEESIIATAMAMSQVAEFGIIQQAVPWARLFAGATIEEMVAETKGLADFLRALGLQIVFLVDPLDGLNRTLEPPELVEAGRSILEPEIRAIAPSAQVFVSFQVDDAWNLFPLPPPQIDHFALIGDFDIDALGLSSYPVFVWETADQIPDTYFSRFRDATDLPLILVEGGWSSEDVGGVQGTLEEQAAFFRRFEELLDGVEAPLWVMLIFADFDVASFGLPPDREASLSNFAFMGIVDSDLRRKPSFGEWERIFERPRAP